MESGEFMIEIGESSRNIVLGVPIHVDGTMQISFPVTENTMILQLMKHPEGPAVVEQIMTDLSENPNVAAMGGDAGIMKKMIMEI